MLSVLFEPSHQVILLRYGGIFTADDLSQLDAAARAFVRRQTVSASIVDLSQIYRVYVATQRVVALASLPPVLPDAPRVYVVAAAEPFGLVRLYATHQEMAGFKPPKIVRTLAEAQRFLQLDGAHFKPLTHADNA
jgi:hypothetical protein